MAGWNDSVVPPDSSVDTFALTKWERLQACRQGGRQIAKLTPQIVAAQASTFGKRVQPWLFMLRPPATAAAHGPNSVGGACPDR
jgi:hypothetical protein